MNDTDVRIALERATEDLHVSADLLDRVHSGARRRVARRRAAMAVAAAVVLTATAANALVGVGDRNGGATAPAASSSASLDQWEQYRNWKGPHPLLERPTGGNRADDAAFLRQAVAAWEGSDDTTPVTGKPHVVWAGDTPAGPAAFVAQRRDDGQGYGLIGLVEPGPDGNPVAHRANALDHPAIMTGPVTMLVGARLDVLVVLDTGVNVTYSTDPTYKADGTIARSFKPVVFTDGAAVIGIPPQTNGYTLALGNPGISAAAPIRVGNSGETTWLPGDRTSNDAFNGAWSLPDRKPSTREEDCQLTGEGRFSDVGGDPAATFLTWLIEARTPDGQIVCLKAFNHGTDVVQVVYGIGRTISPPPVAQFGGLFPHTSAVDFHLRLPDKQGVIVAVEKNATLRYRTGDGQWRAAGGNVALLPDSAVSVEVTRKGKATTLRLP